MRTFLTIWAALLAISIQSQSRLSLNEAINTSIEKANILKIAENNLKIAELNKTKEAAGFSPNINVGASNTFLLNSVKNKLADGRLIQGDNAASNNTQMGAQLSYIIFEGNLKNNLLAFNRETYQVASSELKNQINQVVFKTIELYVQAWVNQKTLEQNQQLLKLANERATLAQNRFQAGSSSKIDWLQTQIEVNQQEAAIILLNQQLTNSKTILLNHLQMNPETQIILQDSIVFETPSQTQVEISQNAFLKQLIHQKNRAEWNSKMAKSTRYPTLTGNLAYNYSRNQNEVGFLLLSQNFGPQANLTLNWNIYNRGTVKRNIKTAFINLETARIALEQAKLDIELSLRNAQNNLEGSQKTLKLHQSAFDMAKESYMLSKERYQSGKISIFELNQSQGILASSMQKKYESLNQKLMAEAHILLETNQLDLIIQK
ncbi:MAG: TolC family protein [Cytophagales bacterium]